MPDPKRYVDFEPKVDGTDQYILADHINEIQDVLENAQAELFAIKDTLFANKVLFTLEHRSDFNTLFLNTLEDDSGIDWARSVNAVYSPPERAVTIQDSVGSDAILYSVPYTHNTGLPIIRVLLLMDTYIPDGTSIHAEVSSDMITWYPLQEEVPFTFPSPASSITIRFLLHADDLSVLPLLKAWAICSYDASMDLAYSVGIEPPELPDIEVTEGTTTVVRDAQQGGLITMVGTPDSVTYLFYKNGRVNYTVTRIGDQAIVNLFTYSDYIDPQGFTRKVPIAATTQKFQWSESLLSQLAALYGGA